jgi:hypothetical protein
MVRYLKESDHTDDLVLCGPIILKQIFEKRIIKWGVAFIWLKRKTT